MLFKQLRKIFIVFYLFIEQPLADFTPGKNDIIGTIKYYLKCFLLILLIRVIKTLFIHLDERFKIFHKYKGNIDDIHCLFVIRIFSHEPYIMYLLIYACCCVM